MRLGCPFIHVVGRVRPEQHPKMIVSLADREAVCPVLPPSIVRRHRLAAADGEPFVVGPTIGVAEAVAADGPSKQRRRCVRWHRWRRRPGRRRRRRRRRRAGRRRERRRRRGRPAVRRRPHDQSVHPAPRVEARRGAVGPADLRQLAQVGRVRLALSLRVPVRGVKRGTRVMWILESHSDGCHLGGQTAPASGTALTDRDAAAVVVEAAAHGVQLSRRLASRRPVGASAGIAVAVDRPCIQRRRRVGGLRRRRRRRRGRRRQRGWRRRRRRRRWRR